MTNPPRRNWTFVLRNASESDLVVLANLHASRFCDYLICSTRFDENAHPYLVGFLSRSQCGGPVRGSQLAKLLPSAMWLPALGSSIPHIADHKDKLNVVQYGVPPRQRLPCDLNKYATYARLGKFHLIPEVELCEQLESYICIFRSRHSDEDESQYL